MPRHYKWLGMLVASVSLVYISFAVTPNTLPAQAQSVSTCNLASPAFCDTFDQPSPVVSRTGQLDPSKWAVSHVNTGQNADGGKLNEWSASNAMHCQTPVSGVLPPNDYFMCGPEFGESMHMMETLNDADDYTYNSEMILQPFDFTNRTGVISFDVDAKTSGSHGWWIEVWVTPDPVPGPHADEGHVENLQNGIGYFFQDDCLNRGGTVSGGQTGSGRVAMSRIQVARNSADLAPSVNSSECAETMPDMKNHIEIRINQNQTEVWMSDSMHSASDQNPSHYNFRRVSTSSNLGLNFSRGFVHFQDSHYDAQKAFGCDCVDESITYHWDNIGFDGPTLPRLRHFQARDALQPGPPGKIELGWRFNAAQYSQPATVTVPNVDLAGASNAMLEATVWGDHGNQFSYRLNGGPIHSVTLAFDNANVFALPVALSELRQGSNTVSFQGLSAGWHVVANVGIFTSGSGTSPTSTPVPATNTPVLPTATSIPNTPTVVPPTPTPGTHNSQTLLPGDSVQVTCAGTLVVVSQAQNSMVLACN